MKPEKKLASAEQLKGEKNSGKQGGKAGVYRRPLLAALALAALALAVCIYFISGRTQPQPAEENTVLARQPETVKLISRSREEVAEVTITTAVQSCTVVNGKTRDSGTGSREVRRRYERRFISERRRSGYRHRDPREICPQPLRFLQAG